MEGTEGDEEGAVAVAGSSLPGPERRLGQSSGGGHRTTVGSCRRSWGHRGLLSFGGEGGWGGEGFLMGELTKIWGRAGKKENGTNPHSYCTSYKNGPPPSSSRPNRVSWRERRRERRSLV